jgi:signal transduction histidine kinase/ActR/RegA family two-component response regulator
MSVRHSRFKLILFLFLCLLLPLLTLAQSPILSAGPQLLQSAEPLSAEERQHLASKKKIRMCVDPDWMPMERIHDGRHDGIASDFMVIFQQALETPIELVVTRDWNQSLDFAQQRQCDILSLVMATPDRQIYMNFTQPYLSLPLVLATRKDESFISDVTLLTDRPLGVVAGYAFAELLRRRYPDIDIRDVANLSDGLSQVERGELFGMIDTLASIGYLVQQGFPELKIAGKFDEHWELGIGVRNDDLLLFSAFEKAIVAADAKTSQQIINRWISVRYDQGIDLVLIGQILAGVALVLAFLLYRQQLLKRHNRELLELNAQLVRLNQEKNEFLGIAAHDLKNPLSGILNAAKLMQEIADEILAAEIREYAGMISENSRQMVDLITNLLDVNQIESGKISVKLEAVDLANSAEKLLKNYQGRAEAKNIRLHFETHAKQTQIMADKNILRQVLDNLISNAIKYSPADREVFVRIVASDKTVRCEVQDQGPGLSIEDQQKLFGKFTRLTARPTAGEHSTGLGLFIVKKMAEAMHGQVWCESTEGQGACFTVEFPQPPLDKDCPTTPPAAANPPLNLATLQVLLAEDNLVNQKVTTAMFNKIGLATDIVADGRQAFEAARDKSYDIIFMDIQMPGMDGLEASRKITNELPENLRPWIIALTGGSGSQEERQYCTDAGMRGYMVKPFSVKDLQNVLQQWQENRLPKCP